MKFFLESLGCPKNLVDSEIMLGLLVQDGHEITTSEEDADVIIVNTCGFIESAREESIKTILEMALMKKIGSCKALIVAGCMAQKYSKELCKEIPEVDAFIGTGEFHRIAEAVKNLSGKAPLELVSSPDVPLNYNLPRIVTTPFFYAYLKIAEGCSHKCTFCVIPELRGKYKSRPVNDILEEARGLAQKGVKELLLIAQDTTQYGKDLPKKTSLKILLGELEKVDGINWIRLLYLFPSSITDELIDFLGTSNKTCRYIDLPVQHCDAEILKKMGRTGNKELLLKLIDKIRNKIPDVTLRTSIIVGFPGEREEQFEDLVDFVRQARFDRLGVFEYSKEEGTKAGKFRGHIKKKTKKDRLHRIMMLQKKISLEKNKSLIGSTQEVLVEELRKDGPYTAAGRTRRDAPDIDGSIYLKNSLVSPGDIISVRITGADEYDLTGEKIT